MKTTKFLMLMGIMILIPVIAMAQKTNLDNLSEKQRNAYLIEQAKKAVLKYGPDFYEETQSPIIERHVISQEEYAMKEPPAKDNYWPGRVRYEVKFLHAAEYIAQNPYKLHYLARVTIWGDTGFVEGIDFGSGYGIILDDPKYKEADNHSIFIRSSDKDAPISVRKSEYKEAKKKWGKKNK